MDIILARHGETAWNREEVFRGTIDVELNETGIRQAQLLADYLKDTPVEAIYSSPLKRALSTAEAIAGYHQLEVNVTPGLIDLDFGEWQGLSNREVQEKYSELYHEWENNPARVVMPGGESLESVRRRAVSVVGEAAIEHEGAVVLVSHRVVNKVLICALLGLDNSYFWNIRQDTCAITTFSYVRNRLVLTGHNITSYLKPLKTPPLADF